MRDESAALMDPGPGFLALSTTTRCPTSTATSSAAAAHAAVAEDLTSQTFLAAVQAVRRDAGGARLSRPPG